MVDFADSLERFYSLGSFWHNQRFMVVVVFYLLVKKVLTFNMYTQAFKWDARMVTTKPGLKCTNFTETS